MPCQITKPTFALLARYFDRTKLFYSVDEKLRDREGIKWIPQLVAYLPQAKVHSDCGGTTAELWQKMNMLVDFGRTFQGTGKLVCTETECKIESLEEGVAP
jgi:hypothetical protein